jgi:hypothetical protein
MSSQKIIQQALQKLKRRSRRFTWLSGLSHLTQSGVLCLFALYGIDRILQPPLLMRILLLIAASAWLGLQAYRHLWVPLNRVLTEQILAGTWEKSHPELKDAFATAVELQGRAGELSIDFLQSVEVQAAEAIGQSQIKVALPVHAARKNALQAFSAVTFLLTLVAFFPAEWSAFQQRLRGMAVAWPGATQLVLLAPKAADGNLLPPMETVAHQEWSLAYPQQIPLVIRIRANGKIPANVEAITNQKRLPLKAIGGREFLLRIPARSESLTLSFVGGEDQDGFPKLHLNPGLAPAVTEWKLTVTPPAYTQQNAEHYSSHGIQVLEGSRIQGNISTNLPVQVASFLMEDAEVIPIVLLPDGKHLSFDFLAKQTGTAHLQLQGIDGFTRQRASSLTWEVFADQNPKLENTWPLRNWATGPLGLVPFSFAASDDFGLTSLEAVFEPLALPLPPGLEIFPNQEIAPLALKDWMFANIPASESLNLGPGGIQFRLSLRAGDSHQPKIQYSTSVSKWASILTETDFETRLNQRMQGLRGELESMHQQLADFLHATPPPQSGMHAERLWRRLNRVLGDLEWHLIERIFTPLDTSPILARETLGFLFSQKKWRPGAVTRQLSGVQGATLSGRSGLLFDLSQSASTLAHGPAEFLRNPNADVPLAPIAKEYRLQLKSMLDILLAWEDYESAVQLLRQLLDRQRHLHLQTREALNP